MGQPNEGTPNQGEQTGQPHGNGEPVDWKAKYEALLPDARKWETRAKENYEAAQKLAQIEEAKKTEEQKTAERLAQAEARARTAELRVMKAEIAADKGLPASMAGRLVGSTKEEIEADAAKLLAEWGGPTRGGMRTVPLGALNDGAAGRDAPAADMNARMRGQSPRQ